MSRTRAGSYLRSTRGPRLPLTSRVDDSRKPSLKVAAACISNCPHSDTAALLLLLEFGYRILTRSSRIPPATSNFGFSAIVAAITSRSIPQTDTTMGQYSSFPFHFSLSSTSSRGLASHLIPTHTLFEIESAYTSSHRRQLPPTRRKLALFFFSSAILENALRQLLDLCPCAPWSWNPLKKGIWPPQDWRRL